jgi:CheY-like chemotaxis protein
LLGDLGLNFAESSAADEGLKYCNDNSPDVVVMAASPEGMAPSDFIRRMRKTARGKKPVIILYANEPDAEEIGQSILEGRRISSCSPSTLNSCSSNCTRRA